MSEPEMKALDTVDSSSEFHWSRVMAISAEMKRLASSREWEELALLAWERHDLLIQNFQQWMQGQDACSLRRNVEDLAASDRDTLAMARTQQEFTCGRLRTLEQGKKALRAYDLS